MSTVIPMTMQGGRDIAIDIADLFWGGGGNGIRRRTTSHENSQDILVVSYKLCETYAPVVVTIKIAEAPQLSAASTAEAPMTLLIELFSLPTINLQSFNSAREVP